MGAKNKYGCRVIQRLFERCSAAQLAPIIEDLLEDFVSNCLNRYGNFVMQCLLEHCTGCQRRRFIQTLITHVQHLGTDVKGCSVIRKALATCVREDQAALANVIVSTPGVCAQLKASQGERLARLAVKSSNELGRSKMEIECAREAIISACPPLPSEPTFTNPKERQRRRGAGGGAAAQLEAEARDLLESLQAACRRRAPARITKAMEKIAREIMPSSTLPLALIDEASQAFKQATQVLASSAVSKKKHVV